MADTFDPDERFSLDMEPEEVLRRMLSADEDETKRAEEAEPGES